MIKVLGREESNCPLCGEKIDAVVIIENGDMFMMRQCGEHGAFKDQVDESSEMFEKWHKEDKDSIAKKLTKKTCGFGCKSSCSGCSEESKGEQ